MPIFYQQLLREGDDLIVLIPAEIAEQEGLHEGQTVALTIVGTPDSIQVLPAEEE